MYNTCTRFSFFLFLSFFSLSLFLFFIRSLSSRLFNLFDWPTTTTATRFLFIFKPTGLRGKYTRDDCISRRILMRRRPGGFLTVIITPRVHEMYRVTHYRITVVWVRRLLRIFSIFIHSFSVSFVLLLRLRSSIKRDGGEGKKTNSKVHDAYKYRGGDARIQIYRTTCSRRRRFATFCEFRPWFFRRRA